MHCKKSQQLFQQLFAGTIVPCIHRVRRHINQLYFRHWCMLHYWDDCTANCTVRLGWFKLWM